MSKPSGAASVSGAMSQGTGQDRPPASTGVLMSEGMNQGMRVLSYLLSGVLLYGLLGWAGDHVLGTSFLLPVGIVVGAGFGVYVIIRRFGQVEPTAEPAPAGRTRTDEMEGTT